jgi:hypothetical protein
MVTDVEFRVPQRSVTASPRVTVEGSAVNCPMDGRSVAVAGFDGGAVGVPGLLGATGFGLHPNVRAAMAATTTIPLEAFITSLKKTFPPKSKVYKLSC